MLIRGLFFIISGIICGNKYEKKSKTVDITYDLYIIILHRQFVILDTIGTNVIGRLMKNDNLCIICKITLLSV